MGKKSSSPPDVVGAAETEGEYSRETARDVTYADRPDQYGPLGNVRWGTEQVIDPATGEKTTKWTQNQTLDPRLQGSLDNSLGMMQSRGDLAATFDDRIANEMGTAPEWGQFGDVVGFDPASQRQAAEDAAYGKATARLGDRFGDSREQMEIRLRNQGLAPGDQAYDATVKNFMQGKNDAYEQAQLGSVAEGRREVATSLSTNERANALRDREIQEYLAKRGFSLSEANRLTEGQTPQDLSNIVTGGSA